MTWYVGTGDCSTDPALTQDWVFITCDIAAGASGTIGFEIETVPSGAPLGTDLESGERDGSQSTSVVWTASDATPISGGLATIQAGAAPPVIQINNPALII